MHGAACFALSTELGCFSPILHSNEVGRAYMLPPSCLLRDVGLCTDRSSRADLNSVRLRVFRGAVRTSFAVLRSCAPGPAVSFAQRGTSDGWSMTAQGEDVTQRLRA